ncbi:hypothetical protein ACFYQ5_01320 [Streptomyces sp. NPDC005794]|uniref:hypothetical protein n=1 Tax=Streptomyces sp. NPDC005794 TaxID=3364733 RepID=UPI0036935E88
MHRSPALGAASSDVAWGPTSASSTRSVCPQSRHHRPGSPLSGHVRVNRPGRASRTGKPALALRDLSFGYDPNRPVLHGVTRSHEPDSGSLLFDGSPATALSRVAACGRHEELLTSSPTYRELAAGQMLRPAAAPPSPVTTVPPRPHSPLCVRHGPDTDRGQR